MHYCTMGTSLQDKTHTLLQNLIGPDYSFNAPAPLLTMWKTIFSFLVDKMLFFALTLFFIISFVHVDSDGMINFYVDDDDKDGSTDV